jgi:DNA adenine methylase
MPPDAPATLTQVCPPFLRWAGSKRRLLPILQTFWTKEHKRYVEPFAGSACLFFAIKPPKAILGDLNPELVSMYREVKYRLPAVLRDLHKIPLNNAEEYKRLRATDPASLEASARAARFIYLNRYCFNGIYRTNLKGQFNVPFSGRRCGNFPVDKIFQKCARRLRVARFMNADFEGVLDKAERGDLIYMDPPFAVRKVRVFREYDPSTFTHEDIKRLRSWMNKLDRKRISFVVSYAESDEADVLRRGFASETVTVRRHIAGFVGSRILANEVIISNT